MMNQFDVYLANLDPTIGSEIKKTRPVTIVSPNELNHNLRTVIIAPITSKEHGQIPTRIQLNIEGETNYAVLDQIRTLDKSRLYKHICVLSIDEANMIKSVLVEMFS